METKNINKLYKNKYYVYRHLIDGKVFYIGKGSGIRAVDFKYRPKKWNELIGEDLDLVEVEIIKTFDCEKEALTYEKSLIESLSSSGVNLTNTTHNYKPDHKIKKDNPKKIEKHKDLNKLQFDNLTKGEFNLLFDIISASLETDSRKVVIENYDIKNLTEDILEEDFDSLEVLTKAGSKIRRLEYDSGERNFYYLFNSITYRNWDSFSDITIEVNLAEDFETAFNKLYKYFIE